LLTILKLKASVITDKTGIKYEIHILITNEGELSILTDYILYKKKEGISNSTINEIIRITKLFLEYIYIHKDLNYGAQIIYSNFARRIYTGTIGSDGIDPSNLYWLGHSKKTADKYITQLSNFFDWLMETNKYLNHPNPLIKANKHEEKLNNAAWFKKNQYNFLGHIKDTNKNETIKRIRLLKNGKSSQSRHDEAKPFPHIFFKDFLTKGINGPKNSLSSLRNTLIILLMHYGGLRVSEALSLWVTDVYEEDNEAEKAMVRIYDEREGLAPYGWKDKNGNKSRKEYLKQEFQEIPRIDKIGTKHIGRKVVLEDSKEKYIQIRWFPSAAGYIFMQYWKIYLFERAKIECTHPYAFIAFEKSSIGNPLTINAFEDAYQKALLRVGESQNASKGLTPHGHRHAYGMRLKEAGVAETIIRKAFHHKNLESQIVYTQRGTNEITRILDAASKELDLGKKQNIDEIDWETLTKYGFKDIDPMELYTGLEPKFKNKY
jgi:site-specific recombinase XerD